MKNKLFIVPIEALDNRYTKQWGEFIPLKLIKEFPELEIVNIEGSWDGYSDPTKGAFFDFSATCGYKASQAQKIAELFSNGSVKNGDTFFFTDAWNQTIHTVKYISELTGISVKCIGIFHAGWYDPTDILGFTIKNSSWVSHLEQSMYSAYDMVFFGTQQHADKFFACHGCCDASKSVVCGYPLDYLKDIVGSYSAKKKQVVFPHRLNPDKAPYIFDFIQKYVNETLHRPDISFIKTQELNLNKEDYYRVLNESMVIFSANKHENLGIGTFEAMLLGAWPVVPDKLSYAEMYQDIYKYPIMEDFYENEYVWKILADYIIDIVDEYDLPTYGVILQDAEEVFSKFFSGDSMWEYMRDCIIQP